MDAIQYFYQMYIDYLRNLFRIDDSIDLSQQFETAYYSLDGSDIFEFISPFFLVFTAFLMFFVSLTSTLLALCCFCLFLPLFFTIVSMSLVIAYHLTVSLGDQIMELL